ncbi:hypothetical protein B0H12DRAFT_1145016 [Mycena haematopus]|nr:hypothetical protein B0H12DRAFT_1145016 [Mycena haematopus]
MPNFNYPQVLSDKADQQYPKNQRARPVHTEASVAHTVPNVERRGGGVDSRCCSRGRSGVRCGRGGHGSVGGAASRSEVVDRTVVIHGAGAVVVRIGLVPGTSALHDIGAVRHVVALHEVVHALQRDACVLAADALRVGHAAPGTAVCMTTWVSVVSSTGYCEINSYLDGPTPADNLNRRHRRISIQWRMRYNGAGKGIRSWDRQSRVHEAFMSG